MKIKMLKTVSAGVVMRCVYPAMVLYEGKIYDAEEDRGGLIFGKCDDNGILWLCVDPGEFEIIEN